MIIHYQNNLDYNLDDFKVIFAPNSSGKTLYSESFLKLNPLVENVCINKNFINSFLSASHIIDQPWTEKKEWNLNISDSLPFLTDHQITIINNLIRITGVRIKQENKVFLRDLVLKKSRTSARFRNTSIKNIRNQIKVSTSEIETILIYIFSFGYSNITKRIILDDPIEHASFEFEDKFIIFIELIRNTKITILTHRLNLFNRLLSLKNKFVKRKWIVNFFYFLDGKPYLIKSSSSSFFNDLIDIQLPKSNDMFKRDSLERIIRIVFALGYNNKLFKDKFDQISKFKKIKSGWEADLMSDDLIKAISAKRNLLNYLRQLIIKEVSKKENRIIKKLSKINFYLYSKKSSSKEELRIIQRFLNASNHTSEWIMFNEVKLKYLLELISRNIKIREVNIKCNYFKEKLISKYVENDEEHYEKFVYDYFYELSKNEKQIEFQYGRRRKLYIEDGKFYECNDSSVGEVDWFSLQSFFEVIQKNSSVNNYVQNPMF